VAIRVKERRRDNIVADDGGEVLGDYVVDEAHGEAEDDEAPEVVDELVEAVHYVLLFSLVAVVEGYLFAGGD